MKGRETVGKTRNNSTVIDLQADLRVRAGCLHKRHSLCWLLRSLAAAVDAWRSGQVGQADTSQADTNKQPTMANDRAAHGLNPLNPLNSPSASALPGCASVDSRRQCCASLAFARRCRVLALHCVRLVAVKNAPATPIVSYIYMYEGYRISVSAGSPHPSYKPGNHKNSRNQQSCHRRRVSRLHVHTVGASDAIAVSLDHH
jgi:hypothetical protein